MSTQKLSILLPIMKLVLSIALAIAELTVWQQLDNSILIILQLIGTVWPHVGVSLL